MMNLGGGKTVMPVYGLGETAKPRYALIILNEELTAEIPVGPDADGAHDDHRHASGRAPFDEGDLLVRHAAVFRHMNGHRGHDETVLQSERPYVNGLKQWRDIHGITLK